MSISLSHIFIITFSICIAPFNFNYIDVDCIRIYNIYRCRFSTFLNRDADIQWETKICLSTTFRPYVLYILFSWEIFLFCVFIGYYFWLDLSFNFVLYCSFPLSSYHDSCSAFLGTWLLPKVLLCSKKNWS